MIHNYLQICVIVTLCIVILYFVYCVDFLSARISVLVVKVNRIDNQVCI